MRDKDWRILILKLVVVAGVIIIVVRLFNIQVVSRHAYEVLASDQHEIYQKIFPTRGRIFVKENNNGEEGKFFPLAANKEYALVYAQPKMIKNPKDVAKKIYPLLFKDNIDARNERNRKLRAKNRNLETEGLEIKNLAHSTNSARELKNGLKTISNYENDGEFKKLLAKLSKRDDPYEPLKRKVDLETVKEIDDLKIVGIGDVKGLWRYYPDGNIESHILGFARKEDENVFGQYGLEGYFNDILAGDLGYLYSEGSAKGDWIVFGNVEFVEAKNGSDLYLTIDRTIQFKTYEELQKVVEKYKIEDGSIIVMQPKTGAILAMVSYPDFDSNIYNEVDSIDVFNNPAILHTYEPGSVFKSITMAAALDLNKVTPTTKYYDNGSVAVDKFIIRNVDGRSNKWQTMTEVLEKSLNTGAIFVAKRIGNQEFLNYVRKFGFGKKTGIELPGEAAGDIGPLENLNDIYTFTASFGQGITVTPIQMITAFAAIANNGKLMKPYLVDEIVDYKGNKKKILPKQVRQVISPRAATLLTAMLVSVVNNGHAKKARVKGYYIAGKTGTAQIADPQGGYSEDKFNHSFVGFGPVDDPRFVILIKLNNPRGVRFASESTAPIFSKLAKFILKYYEIPPTGGG